MELRKVIVESKRSTGYEEPWEGFFHCWTTRWEEYGVGQYPVAIVERLDGSVAIIDPQYIRFVAI